MKPFSQACINNRDPILEVIKPLFGNCSRVLEIGSGTGQHAVYFADKMPWLTWYTSDLFQHHGGIKQWQAEAGLSNIIGPLELDVLQVEWPKLEVDAVFSANTVHIMSWPAVERMFEGIGRQLAMNGLLVIYGPFNYNNQYTSESNARFDGLLKERDPQSGIRDFEALNDLAEKAGMQLQQDTEMPANNRILHWRKF